MLFRQGRGCARLNLALYLNPWGDVYVGEGLSNITSL